MDCAGCGGGNREGALFCMSCGAPLALRCDSCEAELLAGSRFCDACGAPVATTAEAVPVAAARKVVTVVFADLIGSTALEEKLDAESARALVDRFYSALRKDVEDHGGRVVKFTGDGLMAAFGIPEVREDDADRAVETALAMCATCAALAEGSQPLALKVGVNTGEVVVIEDDDDVVGDAVNTASRLEGAASAGEVLVGESTWKLTRASASYESIEPLILKGKSEPVSAYRLLSLVEPDEALSAPFVGRRPELQRLTSVFDDAVAANAARLVTIVGSPGLGKTRLAHEFATTLGDRARVLEARCDPRIGAAFAPVADALRIAAGIDESANVEEVTLAVWALVPTDEPDRDRITQLAAAVLGAGTPGSTEETFWALRRLVEAAARTRPIIILFDDVHWAEPLLLDLLEHFVEWIRSAPVLLVATGRPELRDVRPSLTEGGRAAAVLVLEGLDEAATERLACDLLGTAAVPSELLARIPLSTEGNPLFVRELVRMLVDDGVLRRDGDAWTVTVDVDAIVVPPTIQSLLAARVDRLSTEERTVVEIAAVIGAEFYRGALVDLLPEQKREHVDRSLESLRRKELVEPAGAYWIDEPVYRFHHILIRDAAYRRLLKETRADIHERVAAWLERKTGDMLGEHDEVIGYHLEQSYDYRRQLERVDDHAEMLGRRAARLLADAARRALDRDDQPSAAALAGRSLALPSDDPDRADTLIVRCEALLSMGDVASGALAVADLESIASTPRLAHWTTCFAGQLSVLTEPERLQEIEKRVASAASELEALGDAAGAAKAHNVHASALGRLGRMAECDTALDRALTAAREANDRVRITSVLGAAPVAALWGPNPVSRAGGRCLDIVRLLRITTGSPAVEATSERCQAVLEAFRGRADAARRMLEKARATQEELGLRHGLLETEMFAGLVELTDAQPEAAAAHLRAAYDGLHAMGIEPQAAQAAAFLARAHLSLGDDEPANAFATTSEELAGQDLQAAIAWRCVRAELLARRGSFGEARAAVDAAVEIASKTDSLIYQAHAHRSVAAVCRAAGDLDAAMGAEELARSLYERKGATALVGAIPVPTTSAVAASPDAVSGAQSAPSLENDCSRSIATALDLAFVQGDWDTWTSMHAERAVSEDRRRGLGHRLEGRQAIVDANRDLLTFLPEIDATCHTLAIRGEALALSLFVLRDPSPDAGFSAELLGLTECDGDGRFKFSAQFDPDDLDAAMDELDDRYFAGEGAPYAAAWSVHKENATAAYNRRDWDAYRSSFDEGAEFDDHRPASAGIGMGVDDLIRYLRAGVELVPDLHGHIAEIVGIDATRLLCLIRNVGTSPEGTPIEFLFYVLQSLRAGKVVRMEAFPVESRDDAIACFEQLRTSAPTDVGPPENLATRICERLFQIGLRGWEAGSDLWSPDAVTEDRRRGMRTELVGRDAALRNLAETAELGGELTDYTCIATRGDRFALYRCGFRFGSADAPFDSELIIINEVDTDGRLLRGIIFDADDRDAAFAELDVRFAQAEGVSLPTGLEGYGALNSRDLDAMRRLLADDLVFVDHRPASLGTINGFDEWARAFSAWRDVADLYWYVAAVHATSEHGWLSQFVGRGTNAEGAPVEVSFQGVELSDRDGKVALIEVFPVDALDAARARFDELTSSAAAETLQNRATLATSRFFREWEVENWDAVSDYFATDCRWEDRRVGMKNVYVGRDAATEYLTTTTALAKESLPTADSPDMWFRADVSYLATRGESLALGRVVATTTESLLAVELVGVWEVGEDGRLLSFTCFDADDLDAAYAVLDERYLAGECAP